MKLGITVFDRLFVDLIYARTLASGNSLLFDHFGAHAGSVIRF